MTTIATDGRTIAADGLACFGNEVVSATARKMAVRGGRIYALAGAGGMMNALIDWVETGASPNNMPPVSDKSSGFAILVIGPDPSDRVFYSDVCPYPQPVPPVFAFGSGADFALGAMHAGLSPEEAIGMVIRHRLNVHTGGEIQVIDIASVISPVLQAAAE